MWKRFIFIAAALIIICLIIAINPSNFKSKDKDGTIENLEREIPILMYHHFQRDIPENLSSTTVTPEEFEDHLKALLDNGYKSISFYEYFRFVKGNGSIPEKPIIITFDDGYESNYSEAFPLLKKYNTKAAISIVTNSVGKKPGSFPHFTWEQAKDMETSGLVEIYNHTSNHKICSGMSKDELIKNVSEAQNEIENKLGKRKIKVFTYPEGRSTEDSRNVIESLGFEIQLSVNEGLNDRETPLDSIKRINIKHGLSGQELVKMLHGMEK